MADREGKIPESVFKIGVGVLYGTAILAASMRTALQIHFQRRMSIDDAFLLLACAALTAAISVLYSAMTPLNFVQGPGSGVAIPEAHSYQVLPFTHLSLVWTAIFSVKFSFLSFFHQIVDRIQSLMLHWKIVGVMNVVACAFCVCFPFMACPKKNYTAIQCANRSEIKRESAIAIAATALDLATDTLIVSIPVRVLWNVRIRSGQKLGIGVFLSLNIFMIMIACIRIIGFNLFNHAFSWQVFWLQVEGSVAVIMVSLTAFRSVFASEGPEAMARKARPWYTSTVAKLRRHKAASEDYSLEGLPAIPSATLSGMRTFIRGSRLGGTREAYDELTGHEPSKGKESQVLVTEDVAWLAEAIQK